jgi:membrane-associated phospholipid phosphatase
VFRYKGGWWQEAAYALAFVLVTLSAAKGWTAGADNAVREFCLAHQQIVVHWIAVVINKLGQAAVVTWTLSGGLTLYLLYRTRKPVYALPWVVAFVLTYLTVGPVKIWSERDAPSSDLPNRVEFFNQQAEYSMSYPSGHVVNALVWWGIVALLTSRLWDFPMNWTRVAAPAIVFVTTTYLSHHWLTDGLGAIALALLLDRLIHRFRWDDLTPRLPR